LVVAADINFTNRGKYLTQFGESADAEAVAMTYAMHFVLPSETKLEIIVVIGLQKSIVVQGDKGGWLFCCLNLNSLHFQGGDVAT